MDRLVIRKSDGAVFEPSTPDGYGVADAMRDLARAADGEDPNYFFRRVRWVPAPWWKFWAGGCWERTGEVWEPETSDGWSVRPTDPQP